MATTQEDTIVAIATPPGEGAIGIVRLSGPQAIEVVGRLFRPVTQAPRLSLQPARAYHGTLLHPHTGEMIDEVLTTTYRAPKSYTGEDVAEISAHGSTVVLRSIVEACLAVHESRNTDHAIRLADRKSVV